MDKRSIIFVFTMVISFFLINQWYSSQNQEKLLKNIQNEASFETSMKDVVQNFSVSNRDIPLVHYADSQNPTEKTGMGVLSQGSFITIKNKDVPKKVVIFNGKQNLNMDLIFQSDEGFCFYSESIESQLVTAFLPQFKQIPVALVPCIGEEKSFLTGVYQNQKITLSNQAKEDSIVFVESGKTYLPIGIYSAKAKKFQLLSSFDLLRDFLAFKYIEAKDVKDKEIFYVLENDYQQIVFSNLGGAIAEINLPFKSENNKSIVLPVQIDRLIQNKFPYEASFPLAQAYGVNSKGEIVNYTSKVGGYYPLLRRDLLGKDGKKSFDIQSRFYALNLIYNGSSFNKSPYKMTRMERDLIEFEGVEQGRKIIKTYRLPKEDKAPYSLILSLRIDGSTKDLYLASGIPEVELVGGSGAPQLQYAQIKKEHTLVEKVKLPKATVVESLGDIAYVANSNGYFGLMLSSLHKDSSGYATAFIPGDIAPSRLSILPYDQYPKGQYPGYEIMIPLDPNQKTYDFAFYAGPVEENVLLLADKGIASSYKDPGFKESQTYYGFFSFISEPFANFLFLLMKMFYAVTKSWGFSIILLTVAMRIMLYPFNSWATKANLKSQEVQPKMQAIQEKFKKDPQRLQQEMMKLYKEHNINPFAGFLPLLIQIPFMIGMFDLLKSTFQLRGASFIPGWINNLSMPDTLFSWSYPLPLIGTSFHLLPILVALVMLWQQRLNTPKIKTEEMTDTQRQQQTIGTIFTVAFPIMFYNFASGLNLYWFFSTLFAILQQIVTKKIKEKKLG